MAFQVNAYAVLCWRQRRAVQRTIPEVLAVKCYADAASDCYYPTTGTQCRQYRQQSAGKVMMTVKSPVANWRAEAPCYGTLHENKRVFQTGNASIGVPANRRINP